MKVAEKFVSINGEGRRAGQLAVFIRFTGCNLDCSYCDTRWANEKNCPYEEMTPEEIYSYIKSKGIRNVTLTGGEPLLQKDLSVLLDLFSEDDSISCEIETNGSLDISWKNSFTNPPSITMDYKSPSSGMNDMMYMPNYEYLDSNDTVKFVCGNMQDLEKAYSIIEEYSLTERCAVYISPVYGKIEAEKIVEFMKEKKLSNVNLQLQLHKYIWDPEKKGV